MNSRLTFAGSNINHVKRANMSAVLLSLLFGGPTSRVQLTQQTSLSSTTITNLTAELLQHGIIVEEGPSPTSGTRRVGRPPQILRLVPNARYVIGVHIGIGTFRVALVDLSGQIVSSRIEHFDTSAAPCAVLDAMVSTIEAIVAASGVAPDLLLGAGVGASGLVNYEEGINLYAARLGWRDVHLQAHLEEGLRQQAKLEIPVCVDNNVRSMALGEAFFGAGRGVGVLAFIYGRIGVGAGIVVDGQVFRGAGAGAGEVGHTIVLPHDGELCSCGQRGCLETLISEPVLMREAKALARENPESLLARSLGEDGEERIDAAFRAAREGDQAAREMIAERANYLGIALANLVNIVNPEVICLGGIFAEGSDLILPTAEAVMRRTAFAGLGEKVRLQTTSFGWRAGVIGAASLALTSFFYETTSTPRF